MTRKTIEGIVRSLVDDPGHVEVTESEQENGSRLFLIKVADGDRGKIIGRNGQTIKSIRALIHSLGGCDDKEVVVDVVP